MPFPSGTYLTELTGRVRDEFEYLYAQFQSWLNVEHKASGQHGAIHADSLTLTANASTGATGDVVSDGVGTFDGNVTADADGLPVIIGAHTGGASGIDMQAVSATSRWLVSADPIHSVGSLTFRDM